MELSLPFESFTLDNGLTVIVHEDHSVPIASVNLWYRVGSANELPGRTGFAHLFEHLMFEGSANVPEGEFDNLLESAGGINNGSTSTDRTNYWETVPSNAVELALWLEADRMGGLLEAMTRAKLDAQRSVVQNERRQSYENRPYGLARETIIAELYPPAHPYSWPVIGSMADLEAATMHDVTQFFRTYYAPNNAILAVAGDVRVAQVRELVQRHFGGIARGPAVPSIEAPRARLEAERRRVLEDDVSLPRLYMAWHSPPYFAEGDAELDVGASILSEGKNSRLYRRLVYERQTAQDVSAFQSSGRLGSSFWVVVTARPEVGLDEMEATVREELTALAADGPTDREVQRAVNSIETSFVDGLQTVGGFDGKADRLNLYQFHLGDPGYVQNDLARYAALSPTTVRDRIRRHLVHEPPVILSVVPRGRADLAAGADQTSEAPRPVPAQAAASPPREPVGVARSDADAAPDRRDPLPQTTAPPGGAAPELSLPDRVRHTLSNGLGVILVEQHELPVADLRLVVRGGIGADAPARAGLATLLADMLDEGTETRSALELADAIEFLGADLSTSAGWDETTVALHVLEPRLGPALDLMADVTLRPVFPEAELERKRAQRLARLVQLRDEPRYLASDAFTSVLYGARHPYGVSSLGTDASVRALTREDLLEAYRRRFVPGNAFLVVTGDVTLERLSPLLEDAFGSWRGTATGVTAPAAPPAPAPTTVYLVDKPGAAQSEIRIGQLGVARGTPDHFPLLVMNTILGGSFTSRLNMNLREDKGYTYGARSGFDQRLEPGPFTASAAVQTAVTDSAVLEFLREMRGIREERVAAAELERARSYLAYGLARRFETADDIARNFAEAELYDLGDDYFDTYVARVRAVTAEDVHRAANEYLDPSRWAIVVAGDRTQIEPQLRALGLGDVVIRSIEPSAP